MKEPNEAPKAQIPCKHLRTNNMYYSDPIEDEDNQSEDSIFWCLKTHEGFGPDGEPALKTECCAGRSCHVV